MIITELDLVNFMNIPKAHFNFSKGINVIGGENGCISGDSFIHFNRAFLGKSKKIKDAYKSWNNIPYKGSHYGWNKKIPTYVRSYFKSEDLIKLNTVNNILYSGEKDTYTLLLENNFSLRATFDHKIMTKKGYKLLGNLTSDDEVMIDYINPKGLKHSIVKEKSLDREIYGIKYHKFAQKECITKKGKKIYYRLPIHRLIYEAHINNLSYKEYLSIIKNDMEKASTLIMYSPKEYVIHHLNHNHYDNSIENLKLCSINEHMSFHSDYKQFLNFIPSFSKVKSVIYYGKEDTYDIQCTDPNNNFTANNIIIHNSGKSSVFSAIAFCITENKKGDSWKDYVRMGENELFINMVLYKTYSDAPIIFNYKGNLTSETLTREIRYKDQLYKNAECTSFLESYFDMDMMENIVFHLQDSQNVASLTPAKRRDLLKKVFNSDFSKIVEKVKEDVIQQKTTKEKNELEINLLKNSIDDNKNKYIKLTPLTSEEISSITSMTLDIEKLEQNISFIRTLKQEKESILSQAQSLSKVLSSQKIDLENHLKSIQDTLVKNNTKFVSNEKLSEKHTQDITDYRKQLIEIDQQILETQKLIESNDYEDKKSIADLYYNYYIKEKLELETKEKQLAVFNKNPLCPTCGQMCTEEHKDILENEVTKLKTSYQKFYKDYFDANELVIKSKNELDLNNNSLMILKNKIDTCNLNIKVSLNSIESIKDNNTQLIGDNTSLIEKQKEMEIKYESISNELSTNDAIINSMDSINKELLTFKEEIIEKEKSISSFKDKIKNIESTILLNKQAEEFNERLKNKEIEDDKRIKVLSSSNIETSKNITDLDYIKSFYETELPNHIMIKVCSLLEAEMNNFLTRTKDNFICNMVQSSKGIDFFYKAQNDPKWIKAKMASGFESILLTVAFKIAVASAYNTRFIVLDEIDKTATEKSSLKLFNNITSIDSFDQMFIITHKPQSLKYLKDMNANVYYVENGVFSEYN